MRVLLIQQLFKLSDVQRKFQVHDQLSFQRFVRLRFSSLIPDRTTIWSFKECLIQANAIENIFQAVNKQLSKYGSPPRLASAAARLGSGAAAAAVYCLRRPALSAAFLGFLYVLGMLMLASLLVLIGPVCLEADIERRNPIWSSQLGLGEHACIPSTRLRLMTQFKYRHCMIENASFVVHTLSRRCCLFD